MPTISMPAVCSGWDHTPQQMDKAQCIAETLPGMVFTAYYVRHGSSDR